MRKPKNRVMSLQQFVFLTHKNILSRIPDWFREVNFATTNALKSRQAPKSIIKKNGKKKYWIVSCLGKQCFKRLTSKKRNQEKGRVCLLLQSPQHELLLKYVKVQITIFPSCRHIVINNNKHHPHKFTKQTLAAYKEEYSCLLNLSPK